MKSKSIIKDKSFTYAVKIVRKYQYLTETKKEFILSKQLLRSGTSVGALVREAQNAETIKDFIHKLGISQKECDESMYWLELLKATEYLSDMEFSEVNDFAEELPRMIRSAILTSKNKLS